MDGQSTGWRKRSVFSIQILATHEGKIAIVVANLYWENGTFCPPRTSWSLCPFVLDTTKTEVETDALISLPRVRLFQDCFSDGVKKKWARPYSWFHRFLFDHARTFLLASSIDECFLVHNRVRGKLSMCVHRSTHFIDVNAKKSMGR